MKRKIAVVDDNNQSSQQIDEYIARYSQETGEVFEVAFFADGEEITDNYKPVFDIIFMDVEMRWMDGFSAAEKIRQIDAFVIIIFITNMSKYAVRGYAVDALSYLVKPVPYFAFSQELSRSLQRLDLRKKSYQLFVTEEGYERVDTSDILYFESMQHKIIAHTKTKQYTATGTMRDLETKLIGENFFRCNSGYLVNLAEVTGVRDNCALVGKNALLISRPRKKDFIDALTEYIGRK